MHTSHRRYPFYLHHRGYSEKTHTSNCMASQNASNQFLEIEECFLEQTRLVPAIGDKRLSLSHLASGVSWMPYQFNVVSCTSQLMGEPGPGRTTGLKN
ncbi:MAG: hypothetical protein QGD92_07580 [Gammaproteobacteria bacterium]|nr:hypothetical protein [Gammaproteobacteria bacterium]